MLRQELQPKIHNQGKNFEDCALYKNELDSIPLEQAIGWAIAAHCILFILMLVTPVILQLLGLDIALFQKLKPKVRDIEFVLVNQPEQEPINKNTNLRAERNTRAGGEHNPKKKIAPPQPALPKSAPSQQAKKQPQKQVVKKQQAQQVAKAPQEPVKKVEPQKPAPPKPMTKPTIPPTKVQSAIKLPIPPSQGIPKIASVPSGPVSTTPNKNYGSQSSSTPKPIIASGGYSGSSSTAPSNRGTGAGSAYSPGGGSIGNPGPGNPNGPAGVDALKEPNFGPYMSELSRRIKANWDPPRGDESKRVVLLFRIAKDGRLLNVKVLKSSGTPAADRAAQAAVELTAPFRPLPPEFKGNSVPIEFTFDYNVINSVMK